MANPPKKQKIVVICGPTAVGKSALSIKLARVFNAEIVSADSMQVYRYMDIGTAKPDRAQRVLCAHHMIDIIEPDEPFSVADYRDRAQDAISDIAGRGKNIIICGGTGLYIRVLTGGLFEGPPADPAYRRALTEEAALSGREALYANLQKVDPVYATQVHHNNIARIVRALEVFHITGKAFSDFHSEHAFTQEPYEVLKLFIQRPRAELYARIERRTEDMLKAGLINETKELLKKYSRDLKPMRALGYKEMVGLINGEYSKTEAVELLKKNTRNYAKRQVTWFKKEGALDVTFDDTNDIENKIKEFLL